MFCSSQQLLEIDLTFREAVFTRLGAYFWPKTQLQYAPLNWRRLMCNCGALRSPIGYLSLTDNFRNTF